MRRGYKFQMLFGHLGIFSKSVPPFVLLVSSSDFLDLQKPKIQTSKTLAKVTMLASKPQPTSPAPTKPLQCLKTKPNTPSLQWIRDADPNMSRAQRCLVQDSYLLELLI